MAPVPEDRYASALDLAYEVMRGYDALVILDVSPQGGEPGTLYVMEPDEESVPGGIEDGDVINPHAMDPQTVLRFVKTVGSWPGLVRVVACEPGQVDAGFGLSDEVRDALDRAVSLVLETVEELVRENAVLGETKNGNAGNMAVAPDTRDRVPTSSPAIVEHAPVHPQRRRSLDG